MIKFLKFLIKLAIFVLIVALVAHYGIKAYKYIEKEYLYPIKHSQYIEKYAKENELEISLVYAVVKNESGFDSSAVSDVGAKGLMQLTEDTYKWVCDKSDFEYISGDDLFVPEKNIRAGCKLLRMHLQEFGDKKTALAAYHAGRSKVKEWLSNKDYSKDGVTLSKIPFSDTASYVEKVISTEKKYKEIYTFE